MQLIRFVAIWIEMRLKLKLDCDCDYIEWVGSCKTRRTKTLKFIDYFHDFEGSLQKGSLFDLLPFWDLIEIEIGIEVEITLKL
jgi:hypothetical protein